MPCRALANTRRFADPRWRVGLIAAAAVVVAVLGVNTAALVRQNRQIDDIPTAQSIASLRALAQSARQDPSSRLARLSSSHGELTADAVITRDGTGYLVASLNKLDAAHSYQLWGLSDGFKPVSLGV